MESVADTFSLSQPIHQSSFIQSDQDGLLFGLDCISSFLEDSKFTGEFKTYFKDGDCVFEGQKPAWIACSTTDPQVSHVMSILSYLSGAYTLLSCFSDKLFPFSIMASSTPDFSLKEWEEKAIIQSDCQMQNLPEKIYFQKEDVQQVLQNKQKQITLSNLKMSKEEFKSILKSLPSDIEMNLYGSFFPSDLEELIEFNIKSVWPTCLQGSFPVLRMKIAG